MIKISKGGPFEIVKTAQFASIQLSRLRCHGPDAVSRSQRFMATKTSFKDLDLKIGFTAKVELHGESDKLYVSQIQVSSEDDSVTRQVCSGLRDHLSKQELENKLVVVVDNLKKCKLRGVASEAMVLCADDGQNKVQLCRPLAFDRDLTGSRIVLALNDQNELTKPGKLKRSQWDQIRSGLRVGAGKPLSVDTTIRDVTYRDPETGQESCLGIRKNGNWIPIVVENMAPGTEIK
ncbi:LAMI_0H13652g1_1 [Lachancea mirantina]|uniref:LAMI_0H13652g1_1 n=1 Tax=Lachancea mirantina TaxID=1230905 RepID=A0A1G4KHV0_9SACH|nr:LAMI_0H13652g1_1 [Lachancea mirantina]